MLRASFLCGAGDLPQDERLEPWLEERFAAITIADSIESLAAAGFGIQPHMTLAALETNPYVRARGFTSAMDHPRIGRALGIGLPVYDLPHERRLFLAARRPGLDTLTLLQEQGLEARTRELLKDGIVAIGEANLLNTPIAKDLWGRFGLDSPAPGKGLKPDRERVARLKRAAPLPVAEPFRKPA